MDIFMKKPRVIISSLCRNLSKLEDWVGLLKFLARKNWVIVVKLKKNFRLKQKK